MTYRTRSPWIAVLLLLCLVATACAGGSDDDAAEVDVTDAPEAADPADDPQATPADAATDAATDAETEAPEDEATTAEPAGDPVTVRFASSAPPSSIALLSDVIVGEGLDTANGIILEPVEFTPDAAEQAILTGQAEAGFFALVSWAKVRAEGQDIVMLGPIQTNHGAVLVRADSEYESLEDLQGQRIATLSPVSGLYTSMQVLAAQLGLSWTDDFEVISGPPPGLVAFLEGGDVEAIVHFEPTVSQLLSSGDYRAVMTPAEAWEEATGEPLLMLGVAAPREWVDANPEAAAGLDQAIRDALTLLAGEPEVIRQYLSEFDLDEATLDVAAERMAEIYIPESGAEIEAIAETILNESVALGIIDEAPTPVFEPPGS
ncbi:MAG TPA: ABC transporter substrate-binding protein [Euzebya sp.]|nr:ABC transporter substrate-binding protein [Euzebya sp.]